jgi:hypothetical protein
MQQLKSVQHFNNIQSQRTLCLERLCGDVYFAAFSVPFAMQYFGVPNQ